MKFNIVGLDDQFGQHRFSNNIILDEINKNSLNDKSLLFVWWLEKVFLNKGYEKTIQELQTTEWFGIMHIPLLTPAWAMTGQNDISRLYYMEDWKKALKNCKGIICFSEHMKIQLMSLYPQLKIFSLLHPIGIPLNKFNMNAFKKQKNIILVGAWLRDYDAFLNFNTSYNKKILLNHYAKGYLKNNYSKYISNIMENIKSVELITFLKDKEYDELLSKNVIFLGLHETSANNALCECIVNATPFIAKRHPAIIEYCGKDYPLLVTSYNDIITDKQIEDAHNYLIDNAKDIKEKLSMSTFINDLKNIYAML